MPNTPVDVDSWGVSACYPQSTFYSLSYGPSIQNHKITMTDFRLCSECLPCSQASLCHYTRHLISDQIELTFARLRYSFGGDRPSQTTHHTLSPSLIQGSRLEIKKQKSGISHCGSTLTGVNASKPTTYPTHLFPNPNMKLQ